MAVRTPVREFQLANPLYKNAIVSFVLASGGVATPTLAPLYSAPNGTERLPNPQRLNSRGAFKQPVYIESPVVGNIEGISVPSHSTGVISAAPEFRVMQDPNPQLEYSFDGGLTWYVAGPISPNGGSDLINYLPSGADAIVRTVHYELDQHIISNLRFMSEVQRNDYLGRVGSMDLHSPIQKVIDYAQTNGLTVDALPGVGLLGSTLEIEASNVGFRGRGRNTIFKRSGDYGHTFSVHGNNATGALLESINLGGFFIDAVGAMNTGAHIHVEGVINSDIDHIWLRNGYHGFWLQATGQLNMLGLFHFNNALFGGTKVGKRLMYISNSAGAYSFKHSGGIFLTNFNLTGSGTPGDFLDHAFDAEGCDGLWIENGHFGNAAVGNMTFSNLTTIGIVNVLVSNVHLDGGIGTGLQFRGATGPGTNLQFRNLFIGSNGFAETGIHVEAGAKFSSMTIAGAISAPKNQAILVESLFEATPPPANIPQHQDVFADALRINGASDSGPGLFPSVEFAAGCGGWKFSGGIISGGKSSHAFKLDATSTGITVIGVDLLNQLTGSFDGTGDTSILVKNCPLKGGIPTIASAAAITIPLGHDQVLVDGNASITRIEPRNLEAGPLILVAANSGTPTFKDFVGGTDNLFLQGDFAANARDSITLTCNGIQWFEAARSPN